MSKRRRQLAETGASGAGAVVTVVVGAAADLISVRNGLVFSLILGSLVLVGAGGLVKGAVTFRRLRRGLQSREGLRVALPRAARSLRWVSCLLPGDEGSAWWAEVTSCLAEAHDLGERRRYIRSYRRGVPQLIWTSWTVQLSASRRRTLS